MMLSYYKYYFSVNKELYISIAHKYGVRPFHVYQLAHGKKAKSRKEWDILRELKEHNIIGGVGMGGFL